MKARQSVLWVITLLLCTTTQAANFAGGTGEPNAPYQIATAEQLCSIGSDPNLLDKHFVLIGDIDLDPNLPGGQVFKDALIAPKSNLRMLREKPFTGQFDGCNHVIQNLIINGSHGEAFGLFGWTSTTAVIQNLQLQAIQISVNFAHATGSVVGNNQGTIRLCLCRNMNINCPSRKVGGLAGSNTGNISQCGVQGNVTGDSEVGGLVGWNGGQISQCSGRVKVTCSSSWMGGGLVGSFYGGEGMLSQCYCLGEVNGGADSSDSDYIGGLVGYGYYSERVSQCYTITKTNGEAHFDESLEPIADSFWNTDTCTTPNHDIGVGLSTAALQNINTYLNAGWDISSGMPGDCNTVWCMSGNQTYPTLAWESEVTDLRYAPDLRGLSLEKAQGVLQGFNLSLEQVEYVHDPHLPEGSIINSLPEGIVSKGQGISVMASQGPYDWTSNAGNGSTAHPYQIATADQLICIGDDQNLLNKNFVLTNNIDLNPDPLRKRIFEHAIIAPASKTSKVEFSGHFNGKGCRIIDLVITSDGRYLGLFGCIGSEGIVQNIGMDTTYILGSNDSEFSGAIAGENLGAIIGCYSDCDLTNRKYIGGLVGSNQGLILSCYSMGTIHGSHRHPYQGGLVGYNKGSVINCLSTASIPFNASAYYSGGLVGGDARNSGVDNSYFLHLDNGGGPDNGLGTALSQEQMGQQENFPEWDFYGNLSDGASDTWVMDEASQSPQLSLFVLGIPLEPMGSGTKSNPYCLTAATDLGFIGYSPAAHYRLSNDIDLSDIKWTVPVIPFFSGHLDGAEHSILSLFLTAGNNIGLIGFMHKDAIVKNLAIHGEIGNPNAIKQAGFLAAKNDGYIGGCQAYGIIQGGETSSNIGGLVGLNNGIINWSHSDVSIEIKPTIADNLQANVVSPHAVLPPLDRARTPIVYALSSAGGIAAQNQLGSILNCYALGSTTSTGDGSSVGGLVGHNNQGNIVNCYTTGVVQVETASNTLGALIGSNYKGSITNCLTTGHVLVKKANQIRTGLGPSSSDTVHNSYYLGDAHDNPDPDKPGTLLTAEDMSDQSSFENWDFVGHRDNGTCDIWVLPQEGRHPVLRTQYGEAFATLLGSGTSDSPYLIEGPEELGAINDDLTAYYQLTKDINLAGVSWSTPLVPVFDGHLEGAGRTITNMSMHVGANGGFIGKITPNGWVANLNLGDAVVEGTPNAIRLGIIAGINQGTINRCSVYGAITGHDYLGGLVGDNQAGMISSSCSDVLVVGNRFVGGLVGTNEWAGAAIMNSYALGMVDGIQYVGGIAGYNHRGDVSNCYGTCTVAGEQAAGLVGENNRGSITNSYFDNQTSNTTLVCHPNQYYPGTVTNSDGLTTAEMQTALPFLEADWDFEFTWTICEGDYPRLQWEGTSCETSE